MRFCVGEQPDWVAKAAPYLFVPREGAHARDTLARLVVQCFRRRRGTPCMPNFQQEVVQQDVELFAICNDWRKEKLLYGAASETSPLLRLPVSQ